jgi:hypothetical protein
MTTTAQNLALHSGDSKILEVTVTDGTGAAVDLTGATIAWQLAKSPGESALVSKTIGSGIAVTDAVGGIFEITLDAADTAALSGRHYHEAEVTDTSGKVSTVLTGAVLIKPELI